MLAARSFTSWLAPAQLLSLIHISKPAPVEKKVEEIRRDIFFTINSYKIAPAEDAKIREVVDFLKMCIRDRPNGGKGISGATDFLF